MKKLFSIALFVSACLFPANPPLHENWVGELQLGDIKHFVQLRLTRSQGTWNGALVFPITSPDEMPLSDVSVENQVVRFSWTEHGGHTTFDGRLRGGLLDGAVTSSNKQGTLQFAPVANLSADLEQRLDGYYEMGPGHLLSVTQTPNGPMYVDYSSGRLGILFPSSEDSYFAGPFFQVAVPIAIHCRLSADPATKRTILLWQDESGQHTGRKVDLPKENVTFKSGDVVLSGTLMLPQGKGPHPAIVRIHGSGPQTRRNPVQGWYAYHGIANLSFDKRGAGQSTGDWREAGISELGDDVIAAIRFLRNYPGIDPDRIGIEAISEGGWIAPVVAVRDGRLRSIQVVNGPAMDYVPELLNEIEERLKARGVTGEDLANVLSFKRKSLQMIADGAGLSDAAWADFQAFVAPYRQERWFSLAGEGKDRNWSQKKLYLMSRIKSSEYWRQVRVPVFAIYSGRDLNVPAARNMTALDEELKEVGNRDFTIRLFPDAEHQGLEAGKALLSDEELRYLKRQVPGFFDAQLTWVKAHLGSPR